MNTKIRVDYEARYVSEYVLDRYPDTQHKLRCPLGSVPELWIKEMGLGKAVRAYRPYRPEVDAVVIEKEKIVIIEGKIFKVLDGVSKLPVYRFLIPETPELQEYKSLPVEARLVTPHPPGWAQRIADEWNITIDLYEPDWLSEYKEKQDRYWTSEEKVKRHQRRETLKGLGFA